MDNSTNQANYLSDFYRQQGTPIWTSDEGGKSYATVESGQKWLQCGTLVAAPEGFVVLGTKGPLRDGELERAAGWAKGIAQGSGPSGS